MSSAAFAIQEFNRLLAAGDAAKAEAVLQRAITRSPMDVGLNLSMTNLQMFKGDSSRALYFAQKADAAGPNTPSTIVLIARLYNALNNRERCSATIDRALAIDPRNGDALELRIELLYLDRRLIEMLDECDRALTLVPNHPIISIHLANALMTLGRADEAVAVLRRAEQANPDNHELATSACVATNYAVGITPREVFETHRRYGRLLDKLLPVKIPRAAETKDPEKRLRIGFQSPDLRQHAAVSFLSSFLPHIDRERFEVVLYYTGTRVDHVTKRMAGMADVFRQFTGLREQDMAALIAHDRVDIIIECGGHFAGHRLPSIHLKPAPLAVTYLAYPNTTGVSSIDYRIVDSYTDPSPGADELCTEKLMRLDPCFLCYNAAPDTPEVAPPPVDRNGFITFGSFNSLQKVNTRVIRAWKRVIEAVPGSRLLIKNIPLVHEPARTATAARFEAEGFPLDRLSLVPPKDGAAEHMAAYAEMDIALDTFPYAGTTTTCEAMWMGVPVVSLVSAAQPVGMHAGRVGLSLLTNAGLVDLAVYDEDSYVAAAANLASDRGRLSALRASLRGTMAAGVLCDARAYARRFEGVLRQAWRRHCAGEPAAGIRA